MFNLTLPYLNTGAGRRRTFLVAAAAAAAIAVACGSGSDDPAAQPAATAAPSPETPATTTPATGGEGGDEITDELTPAERTFASRAERQGWETDFTKILDNVDVREILSGGVPRDGIASIDAPRFAPVSEPPEYLRSDEPVILLELNGEQRAYPLSILTWHEIVNDVVGGTPVVVTFCPLCNTSITFPRTLEDGRVLEFGVSGFLRNSDLIMYDRQTESMWQQITGEAIIGELAGARLDFLPVSITSWDAFATSFPEGEVLLRPTATDRHSVTGRPLSRNYDSPPYAGYDSINNSPFLFDGALDGRLLPMERVATVSLEETEVAYPFSFLAENPIVNDTIGETPVAVFFDNGTESAFTTGSGGNFSKSGSTTLFDRTAAGQVLTFSLQDGVITDDQTGSTWNKFGKAEAGELSGTELEPIVHAAHFWFAWAAFSPDTEIRDSVDVLTAARG